MIKEIEVNGRKFRAVEISDRWGKSSFEYFNERTSEWRTVINWNTRERLFDAFKNEKGQ